MSARDGMGRRPPQRWLDVAASQRRALHKGIGHRQEDIENSHRPLSIFLSSKNPTLYDRHWRAHLVLWGMGEARPPVCALTPRQALDQRTPDGACEERRACERSVVMRVLGAQREKDA
jgi:hypothetical protein